MSNGDFAKAEKKLGPDANDGDVVYILVTHNHEHLGQSIAYARVNGITPPWTEEGSEKREACGRLNSLDCDPLRGAGRGRAPQSLILPINRFPAHATSERISGQSAIDCAPPMRSELHEASGEGGRRKSKQTMR